MRHGRAAPVAPEAGVQALVPAHSTCLCCAGTKDRAPPHTLIEASLRCWKGTSESAACSFALDGTHTDTESSVFSPSKCLDQQQVKRMARGASLRAVCWSVLQRQHSSAVDLRRQHPSASSRVCEALGRLQGQDGAEVGTHM